MLPWKVSRGSLPRDFYWGVLRSSVSTWCFKISGSWKIGVCSPYSIWFHSSGNLTLSYLLWKWWGSASVWIFWCQSHASLANRNFPKLNILGLLTFSYTTQGPGMILSTNLWLASLEYPIYFHLLFIHFQRLPVLDSPVGSALDLPLQLHFTPLSLCCFSSEGWVLILGFQCLIASEPCPALYPLSIIHPSPCSIFLRDAFSNLEGMRTHIIFYEYSILFPWSSDNLSLSTYRSISI